MTENEKRFVRAFIDFESNIKNAQAYIKEEYGVKSEYDKDHNILKLTSEKNDVLDLVSAKEYLNETFNDITVDVMF